jgi:Flp pilus assembly protein TadG
MLVALMGIASFAVDLGAVILARTELQSSVAAAARAGASGLSDGTAVAKSQEIAENSIVNGASLTLLTSDIELGTWDASTKAFTPTASSPNAIRVTGRLLGSRSTAIRLPFASLFGLPQIEYPTSSIAVTAAAGNPGFVGLNSIAVNSCTISSVNSTTGGTGREGHLISNNTIQVNSSTVRGKLYMLAGRSPSGSGSTHDGRVEFSPAVTAPVDPGVRPAVPPSLSVNGMVWYLTPGTHYYRDVTLNSATLSVIGPTTVYIEGNWTSNGSSINPERLPSDLVIKTINNRNFILDSAAEVNADIWAPSRGVLVNSCLNFRGRIVAQSLNLNSSTVVYDTSLPPTSAVVGGGGGGAISKVK